MCRVNDFEIADVLSPSKQVLVMLSVPCGSVGGLGWWHLTGRLLSCPLGTRLLVVCPSSCGTLETVWEYVAVESSLNSVEFSLESLGKYLRRERLDGESCSSVSAVPSCGDSAAPHSLGQAVGKNAFTSGSVLACESVARY